MVDEQNRVIGATSRHEVHSQKLRYRAVHIFVFNKAGELFLPKRSRWKDKQPRKWDSSAAGHLNSGNEYDPTAARELFEEIGVNCPVELVAKIDACRGTGWEFVQLYRARHEGPFVLARSEIECGAFFPMEIVRSWAKARPGDFAPGFLECLKVFDAGLEKSSSNAHGEVTPPRINVCMRPVCSSILMGFEEIRGTDAGRVDGKARLVVPTFRTKGILSIEGMCVQRHARPGECGPGMRPDLVFKLNRKILGKTYLGNAIHLPAVLLDIGHASGNGCVGTGIQFRLRPHAENFLAGLPAQQHLPAAQTADDWADGA